MLVSSYALFLSTMSSSREGQMFEPWWAGGLFAGKWFTDFLFIQGFFHNKKARFVHSHIHLVITGECLTYSLHSREYQGKEKRIPVPVPPPFSKKAMQWGKMAGTNEFAFFRCKSLCTGRGPESGRKKNQEMPSGRYRYQNQLFQNTFTPITRIVATKVRTTL